MAHEFDVVDSEIVLEAPILAVRRDQVRMPGGNVSAREIVEHFGAVAVVAADENNRLYLLNQWRQAAGKRLVELPAGLLDVADEDPLEAAKRELVEEAGLEAESWSLLTDMFSSPGFAEEAVRIYLARGLHAVDKPEAHDEEADMTASWIGVEDAVAMALRGEILNGIALSGILLAAEVLLRGATPRAVAEPFDIRPTALAQRRTEQLGAGADLKRIR
ncbi:MULTISPECIES: NUDIX domain-containing protein [unclassified Corynebacterium]|uniref:NUDIX domain-containing protein n=1 Tax=unclassified Corynebacterium TaxID=2624378 RepID=UPI0011C907FC|nr:MULTISPECIES: NUDIX hydrolase [unclassified Corynebacterium]MBC6792027.1 ADP-ribose pyrophosphatase [Corynebacterium sp. LK26]TXS75866.1 ADP-ribose pyrophosphatase [Corynebacterium sp. LK11]